MAEMIVHTPEVKKTLHDYDIVFTTGMMQSFTVDPTLGDSITFGDTQIEIKLTKKPSKTDPEVMLAPENHLIYVAHVAIVTHRTREVTELTPEEKHEWKKQWDALVSGSGAH